MDDELRKAAQDVVDLYDFRRIYPAPSLDNSIEALRAALAKNANAALQEKGIRDILRDTVRSIIAAHSDGDLDVPLAIADLRAALTKNANAAPQDQNSVSVPLDFLGAVCGALNRWGKSPKLLEKARNFVQHGMGHHTNAVPQDQDAKDAARYRMARFKGTISDEWQESLDHWITLDAALAAMKGKP